MNKEKIKDKLELNLNKLEKEQDELEKEINKTKEFQNTERNIYRAEDWQSKLDDKETELLKDIRYKYTSDGGIPCYRNSNFYEKNILPEVIKSIKKVLGIKRITYLQPREVERITEVLIEIELKKDEEYKKKLKYIKNNIKKWEEKERKHKREKETLLKPLKKLQNKSWKIENKLDEIHRKEMSNTPKEIEKRITEKLQKEKGEELYDNFDENVKKIRLEVVKQQIVSNLESGDDEYE